MDFVSLAQQVVDSGQDSTAIIAVAAIVLSALTFIATQFGSKRTATASYVEQLEKRVALLEKEVGLKDARIEELEEENLRYLRKLVALGG